jgi:NtrC-family two-component system response regulator AlgB
VLPPTSPRGLILASGKDAELLALCLKALGVTCQRASSQREGAAKLRTRPVDLVFIDKALGSDALSTIASEAGRADVIVLGGSTHGDPSEDADRSVWEWVEKPVGPERVRQVVRSILVRRELERQLKDARQQLASMVPPFLYISRSPPMKSILSAIDDVPERAPLLLRGDQGTGRAALAHYLGERRRGPTVELRCDALQPDSALKELCGVEPGSGHLAMAHRGTLVLREVEALPRDAQEAVAEAQERRSYRRPNGTQEQIDVRIVATTTQDPGEPAAQGGPRSELFNQLLANCVDIPSLCDRREDVIPLAQHFLSFFAPRGRFTPDALKVLAAYTWPGNIRELRYTVEEAAQWAGFKGALEIDLAAAPDRVFGERRRTAYLGGDFTLEAVERAHIAKVMANHSLAEAARVLGIDDSTLWRMRKRYEMK